MISLSSSSIITPTITVTISTIAENIDNFINNFPLASLHDADEVVIIIQGTLKNKPKILFNNNYTVIEDQGKGVSHSRNIGVLHAQSDYIWFMDDDILLNHDAIMTVKNYISKYNADIFTVRTEGEENGSPYKSYPNRHKLNRRDIIGISSVEIIASREFIIQSQVRFNEMLGLGTKYPSCEENIFLLDLFDLGAKFIHIPAYVQKHPFINRRMHFTNPNILFAKGVFCKRYNSLIGVLLMFYWVFKSLTSGSTLKDSCHLIYGYNSAENLLNK